MVEGFCGLVIQNRKVLSVKTYGYDIFPGGKKEVGETDEGCLIREFKEELAGVNVRVGDFYKIIEGINPRSKEILVTNNYLCFIDEKVVGFSSEIENFCFIDSSCLNEVNFSETSRKTFESLIEDGLID